MVSIDPTSPEIHNRGDEYPKSKIWGNDMPDYWQHEALEYEW